jgi:hypothetical protein
MPDVELARRPGVELIRTGSWGALTGSWTPTREDILSAVKAQECPAVRRPRLKIGHTDPRFNTGGDGEPALGWFENLRAEDGGNTLLGDQVALPWLSSVQAAAYPDRSIEGNYRHVCALGHQHPFVITAVALLGVTPPAVSTLKSVQDLPEMLGVAASEDVPAGAEHVQVTIRATAAVHTGAMVALIPTAAGRPAARSRRRASRPTNSTSPWPTSATPPTWARTASRTPSTRSPAPSTACRSSKRTSSPRRSSIPGTPRPRAVPGLRPVRGHARRRPRHGRPGAARS